MQQLKLTENDINNLIKEKGKRDFNYFQSHILNTPNEYIRPHQVAWVNSFEAYQRVMLLAPREHLKSSTLTAYLLWKVLYNPELRILIVTISDSLASGMLLRIKSILETNTTIHKLFGDVKGNGVWGAEGLTLKRTSNYTEPTIKAIGIGTSAVGSRCNILICDDLTDSTKADSPAERSKLSERFFGELSSLVSDGGKTIVLGTRKSKDDIYSEILNNKSFYSIVQPAIISHKPEDLTISYIRDSNGVIVDVEVEEDVEVFDAIRWPVKRLLMRRIEAGSTKFLREYQNDISSFTSSLLKEEWLHYTDNLPSLNKLTLYMGVDLAISNKTTSDFTVITTVGVDRVTNSIYLLRMHRSRSDFPTTIENIKDEYEHWNSLGVRPTKITLESNASQLATFQTLFKSTSLPVIPSYTSKGKDVRMQMLAPYFENGRIKLSKDFDTDEVFKQEFINFPSNRYHDDTLDAVEIALRPVLSTNTNKGTSRVVTGRYAS